MADDLPTIIARIDERLERMRLTDRQASLTATGVAHTIRNMRRGSKPAYNTVVKLAHVLGTSVAFLMEGEDAEENDSGDNATREMPMVGKVAAGTWLEVDPHVDGPLYADIPIQFDPNYPSDWQFVVEVSGTSVNRVAPDGAFLTCIDPFKAKRAASPGELVIVEQRRNEGQEVMRTAKRYHPVGDTIELRPDSDDPRWQRPIVIDPHDAEEGTTIKVIGIVIGMYASLQSIDRNRH